MKYNPMDYLVSYKGSLCKSKKLYDKYKNLLNIHNKLSFSYKMMI
jgi:hypothetical protein